MILSRLEVSPPVCFDVAWTSAAIGTLAASWLARSRAIEPHRSRWTWWMFAAAAWLVGQIAWDVYGVIGFPASPSIADVAWWAFALFTMVSVFQVSMRPRESLTFALIETGPLVIAAVALTTAQLWGPMTGSSLALAPKISALTYPALICRGHGPDARRGGGRRAAPA